MQASLQDVAPATVLNIQTFKIISIQIACIIPLQNLTYLKYSKLLNLHKILGRQVQRLVTLVTCFPQQLPNLIFLGIPKWEVQMYLKDRNAIKWEEINISSTAFEGLKPFSHLVFVQCKKP